MVLATATNRSLMDVNEATSIALADMVLSHGDRLVFEFGFISSDISTSRQATIVFGDNSATDLAENMTTTTANNPWIEFDSTIDVAPHIGVLSQTLGALVLAATALAIVGGTAVPTLGALSCAGAGAVQTSASASPVLGAATLAAVGAAKVVGVSGLTLGPVTVAGSGVLADAGALSATLGALSVSAVGALPVSASLSSTLGALSLAGAGTVVTISIGTLVATLGDLTVAGQGNVPIAALLAQSLGDVSLLATGEVMAFPEIHGACNAVLAPLVCGAVGTVAYVVRYPIQTNDGAQYLPRILTRQAAIPRILRR
jgi:hypothetical protein